MTIECFGISLLRLLHTALTIAWDGVLPTCSDGIKQTLILITTFSSAAIAEKLSAFIFRPFVGVTIMGLAFMHVINQLSINNFPFR
ncbi:MAG: hypothetical protein ACKPKO_18345 [Candidatus Fonsibacter sp.]